MQVDLTGIGCEVRALDARERAAVALVRAEKWLDECAGTDNEDAADQAVTGAFRQFWDATGGANERQFYLDWARMFAANVTP